MSNVTLERLKEEIMKLPEKDRELLLKHYQEKLKKMKEENNV
jgi:hypothetical protein